LQNTVRQVLFLPTTREQKYKAKQAIDTFFVRAGDVLSAVLVFAGTTWLALSTQGFALVNAGLVFAWLILAILIGRHYRRLTQARAPDVASRRDGVQLPSTDG
jgi:AAA family ATP:ADP antiporter